MTELFENIQKPETAVLVGVDLGEYDCEASLDELEELAKTAGAEVEARVTQRRETPDSATFIGSGRLREIKNFCADNDVDLLIFDSELTPSQQRNIEDITDVRVVDRTQLILDIFAARARSGEGKLQVELAQLKYLLPRLGGKGTSMSRLGGGIGTRGPGETKLESDRRHIRRKIQKLQAELEDVRKIRRTQRRRREKNALPVVALVGYTNAGKSTLLNYLTGAEVLAENKLFATLDPTTRGYQLGSGQKVLFTDTVGFIRKLPHHLIDAFRSTLEEAKYADLILHVVDASNPQMDEQMHIVYETLRGLGVQDKPVITVFNKQDLLTEPVILRDFQADATVPISAATGAGIDALESKLEEVLRGQKALVEYTFPYKDAAKIQLIRKYGELLREEYLEDGIAVEAYVPIPIYGKIFADS